MINRETENQPNTIPTPSDPRTEDGLRLMRLFMMIEHAPDRERLFELVEGFIASLSKPAN